jgi:hypothetical protein
MSDNDWLLRKWIEAEKNQPRFEGYMKVPQPSQWPILIKKLFAKCIVYPILAILFLFLAGAILFVEFCNWLWRNATDE